MLNNFCSGYFSNYFSLRANFAPPSSETLLLSWHHLLVGFHPTRLQPPCVSSLHPHPFRPFPLSLTYTCIYSLSLFLSLLFFFLVFSSFMYVFCSFVYVFFSFFFSVFFLFWLTGCFVLSFYFLIFFFFFGIYFLVFAGLLQTRFRNGSRFSSVRLGWYSLRDASSPLLLLLLPCGSTSWLHDYAFASLGPGIVLLVGRVYQWVSLLVLFHVLPHPASKQTVYWIIFSFDSNVWIFFLSFLLINTRIDEKIDFFW